MLSGRRAASPSPLVVSSRSMVLAWCSIGGAPPGFGLLMEAMFGTVPGSCRAGGGRGEFGCPWAGGPAAAACPAFGSRPACGWTGELAAGRCWVAMAKTASCALWGGSGILKAGKGCGRRLSGNGRAVFVFWFLPFVWLAEETSTGTAPSGGSLSLASTRMYVSILACFLCLCSCLGAGLFCWWREKGERERENKKEEEQLVSYFVQGGASLLSFFLLAV